MARPQSSQTCSQYSAYGTKSSRLHVSLALRSILYYGFYISFKLSLFLSQGYDVAKVVHMVHESFHVVLTAQITVRFAIWKHSRIKYERLAIYI